DEGHIISLTHYRPADYLGAPDDFPAMGYTRTIGTFADFVGTDPNGTWSLYVVDDQPGNSGEIAGGWDILVSTTVAPVAAAGPDPPTTTATEMPAPNAAGWHKGSVTVTLTTTDAGSSTGVQHIRYFSSGAQEIDLTTVPGASATLQISAPGVTTLNYWATDLA